MTVLDALVQIETNALADLLRKLDTLHNATARARSMVVANHRPDGHRLQHRAAAVTEAIEIWGAAKAACEREERFESQLASTVTKRPG